MSDAPNLLNIIQTWLDQGKWPGEYVLSGNYVTCKCCRIIWMNVKPDRVRYGAYPRVRAGVEHPKYEVYEALAADSELFDKLGEVLEAAEHDPK